MLNIEHTRTQSQPNKNIEEDKVSFFKDPGVSFFCLFQILDLFHLTALRKIAVIGA